MFEKSPQPLFKKEGRSAKEKEEYSKLWFCIDVEFVRKFEKEITLSEVKSIVGKKYLFKRFGINTKGSRLSVQLITQE